MRSESIKELAGALVAVQGAIKGAVKGKENPFFKAKYADLSSVWDACKSALGTNGFAVSQVPNFEGETAYLETILMHTSGEWIAGRYPLRPTKNDPQGMGSAISYARRYALAAVVGVIAEDEDDDGNSASERAPASAPEGVTRLPTADRKAKAKKWGEDQLALIPTLTAKEFPEWHHKWAAAIAATRDVNEALHKRLTEAVLKRQLELSQIATAAE